MNIAAKERKKERKKEKKIYETGSMLKVQAVILPR
jgi:hypothetical protein